MRNKKFVINKNNSRTAKVLNLIGNLFFCVCIVIGAALIIFSSVTIECVVMGSSMSPTLNKDVKNGSDVVYVNEYKRDFKFGEIIVVNIADKDPIIKRVIGVAGDVIDIVYLENDGYKLEINGKLISEDYLRLDYEIESPELQNGMDVVYINFHSYLKSAFPELFNSDNKLVVPDGQIFALGDNRHDSKDSTYYGTFKKEDIMGTVELTRKAKESEFVFYYEYIMDGKFFTTIANCF